MAPWSSVAGKPARHGASSSQVRVFERNDRGGKWLTRAWLLTETGRPRAEQLPPGTTREEAGILAREKATEREKRILRGDTAGGDMRRLTLAELFDMYHGSAKAQRWSQSHKRNRERSRLFWLAQFGHEFPVAALTAGEVEERVACVARVKRWATATERRYLIHIKAATRYAHRKRKALQDDPLTGVDVPAAAPETEGLDYSANEAAVLATPHPAIDPRVTLAASICCDTGRRIGAVRFLRSEDVSLRDGRIHLRFWKSHDKGGKSSTVPVSHATAELVLEQLERDRTKRWGWLFPGQRAAVPLGGIDSTGPSTWAEKLHEAEEVLGIPWVRGRAWHGLKRRHVTLSGEESGGDWALVGDVTGNTSPEVLRKAYRRQSESRKVEQVDRIRARLDRAEGGGDAPGMHRTGNVTADAIL